MARAAVKAKQAQRAQAQAAVRPSRKQRKHASGGNPNQDLFFMRLRRRQKWVFLSLAAVFAVSFVAFGVGSGNGSGLQDIWNSILGGNSDAVSQAQNEIKTNPAKGYKDLAAAYQAKGDLPDAITAMNQYLALKNKKKDAAAWTQLGNYETTQGSTYAQEYQQVLQNAQLQSPGTTFEPTGPLASQWGTNPIDQYYQQQNAQLSGPLYQKAIDAYNQALTAFQNAAKYSPRSLRAAAWQEVATAAQNAGKTSVALQALKNYVALSPNSPLLSQIEAQCKQLGGSCKPAQHKSRPAQHQKK